MKIISAHCFCCSQKLPINIETIKYMFELDLDHIDISCKICGRNNYIEIGKIEFQHLEPQNKTIKDKTAGETTLFD